MVDGRLDRVTVVGSTLVVGRSGGGLESMEKEEGDIGGEAKTALRRGVCIGGFEVREK